jgi:uncharacterized protein (DUF2236 family)
MADFYRQITESRSRKRQNDHVRARLVEAGKKMTAKGQPARMIAKRTAARLGSGGYDPYFGQKLGLNELRDNEHRKAGLALARKHDPTFRTVFGAGQISCDFRSVRDRHRRLLQRAHHMFQASSAWPVISSGSSPAAAEVNGQLRFGATSTASL